MFWEVRVDPSHSCAMRWLQHKKENAYCKSRPQPIHEEICPTKYKYNMTNVFRDFSFVFMPTCPTCLNQGCPFMVVWMFSTYPNYADIAQNSENLSCGFSLRVVDNLAM